MVRKPAQKILKEKKRQSLPIPSESTIVEWKPSLSQINEIINTISALSNTEGGKIFIGVSKSGKIVGTHIGRGTIENLTNQISQHTDPKIHPKISTKKIKGKEIIIIGIKESPDHLVLAFGRPYKRVGKSTLRMSKDEYERLILEKHKEKLYFDSQICKGAILKDINKVAVEDFLKKANIERRFNLSLKIPIKEALTRLNLTVNGRLTNASVLLFAKEPQKFFPQAQIKCARFKGTKPLEFIDMKVLNKNIDQQREDALEFIKEHIKLSAKIVGTQRMEAWEYPIEAIREAITNAICHRDYRLPTEIQIRIFDDRLEIWGCGPLPTPLTVQDLKKKHKSILRNPLIGRCFFLIKYIEEWGTGTNRMIEWCVKHKLPEPLFEYVARDFVVTFRKYHLTEEALEALTVRQRKIAEYMQEHKRITRRECVELLKLSKDTAIRELLTLQKKGLIKRLGKGKNIYYILT